MMLPIGYYADDQEISMMGFQWHYLKNINSHWIDKLGLQKIAELADVFKNNCSRNDNVLSCNEFFSAIESLFGKQEIIEVKSSQISFNKFVELYYDLLSNSLLLSKTDYGHAGMFGQNIKGNI